jgi:hypothetical protein
MTNHLPQDYILAELRIQSDSIAARVAHQDQLFNWTLIFVGTVTGVILAYPEKLALLTHGSLTWVLLFIPLVLFGLAIDYQSQYFMIAHMACYSERFLRSQFIDSVSSDVPFQTWESYLSNARARAGLAETVAWNFRFVLIVVLALIWLLVSLVIKIFILDVSWTVMDSILTALNLFAFIIVLTSNRPLIGLFRGIPGGALRHGASGHARKP